MWADLAALRRRMDAGAQLLSARPLSGGVSARVTAVDVRWSGGETERLVVCEYGARDLRATPEIATQEYELLRVLSDLGLPVPVPRHAEPGLLMTDFMEGETAIQPADEVGCVRQMAAFLGRLHGLPAAAFTLLRPLTPISPRPGVPDDSLSESRIRDALECLGSPLPSASAALHGDFWPGNLLWQGGRLSAVIDWEDAALGDPLADLGNARLELLFFFGRDAMQAFTHEYVARTGADLTGLPYWDLRAGLRPCGRLGEWGLERGIEERMQERHEAFVEAALTGL